MQVTHFLKRKNCKVSLQCVKYVKSKENGKPRSADGPLRTAVAKAIILPLWGLRGIDQLESFGFWGRKFCIKNVEILSVGKIAEFAKFAGGKRRKSPDLVSDKQTAQWAFAASSPR